AVFERFHGVFGRAYDRGAVEVEAGVEDAADAGEVAEGAEDVAVRRVEVVDELRADGHVEGVHAGEEGFGGGGGGVEGFDHVIGPACQVFDVLVGVFFQHRGGEGHPEVALFDGEIEFANDAQVAGVGHDGAIA